MRFAEFCGNWVATTFGALANYKKGPFGSALTKSLFVPKSKNAVKIYEQQNAINKDWKLERYYITTEYYQKMKSFTVGGEDIIVSCAGTIGEVYVLPEEAEIGIINQALMIIRIKNNINKNFYLSLFSNMIDNFSKKYSNGSAIKNIPPFSDLKNYEIKIPKLDEQSKIAVFLSLIDERIETQSKIIEKFQSQMNWICQRYFKQRYASVSGWQLVPLTEILTERKTYETKGNEYPHATLSKDGIYAKNERYDRDFLVKDEEKQYKITHLNDICYNPANLKFGVICRNSFGSAIFSPIYITFEVNKHFSPFFIGYYLTNPDFINRIRKYEEGTIYERMAVSPDDFLRGAIYVPPMETQNKIVYALGKIQEKIDNESRILDKLKEQKKFLLLNMFI